MYLSAHSLAICSEKVDYCTCTKNLMEMSPTIASFVNTFPLLQQFNKNTVLCKMVSVDKLMHIISNESIRYSALELCYITH